MTTNGLDARRVALPLALCALVAAVVACAGSTAATSSATGVPATATLSPTVVASATVAVPRASATAPPPPTQTATPLPLSPANTPAPGATPAFTPAWTATVAPTRPAAPLPSPTVAVRKPTSEFVERPLSDLSPDAVAFLAAREGPRGVAVVVPGRAVIYTDNGDELTPMASVAKVTIMIAVMDRAVREGRPLSEWELSMIRPMITVSDNDSASALWDDLGGGAAVEATLRSMSLTQTAPNPAEAWGASRSTPKEVALLLTKLAQGEILDQPMRDLALELMGAVIPEQTWGVTSGVPTDRPQQAAIAIKDGWLPTKGGWWVNSAGLIMPLSDQPAYAMAVLTRQQPSLEYGIATIEGVAARVHAALHVQPTATPTSGP